MARNALHTCVVNNTNMIISSSSRLFAFITTDQVGLELKFTMEEIWKAQVTSSPQIRESPFCALSVDMTAHSPFNKEHQQQQKEAIDPSCFNI
jgi:hypothetical protein